MSVCRVSIVRLFFKTLHTQQSNLSSQHDNVPDPSKVMKAPPGVFHQDAAMAGALVVHGQGPPPLQPQGFGVVHGQGYYGRRPGY